jgi:two-component system, chemotaxis family, chemotaxis protein CheY
LGKYAGYQVAIMNSLVDNEPLTLPAILDLAAAESFLTLLQQRLQNGGPLRIDAAAVETLTYSCVQIILAALRTYDGISIERPSIAFISAFEDLAIDWKFGQSEDQDPNIEIEKQQTPIEVAAPNEPISPEKDQPNESAMTKRVLTIDDSKTMRDMLMLALVEGGFDVVQAVDGQDGLDVLGKERVDVVITDINMPRMDGYEVIRQLRSNPDHKTMPILVLTTESEAGKKKLAREAGATGWMVKPFDPDQLVATIRKVAP